MRKFMVGFVVIALIATTFCFQAASTVSTPPPKPPAYPNPAYINTITVLAKNHIAQADGLLAEANDLLSKAKTEEKDTSACEALLGEATELLDMAKSAKNPIYANNLALKALKLLKEAVGCLGG